MSSKNHRKLNADGNKRKKICILVKIYWFGCHYNDMN